MRDYQSGTWGFALIWGLRASVFPKALALAIPNAIVGCVLSLIVGPVGEDEYDMAKDAFTMLGLFTSVMFFVLTFRSNIAYRRWWEGGTLLQQTRGEWFNAYSSLIAFTTTDVKREAEVEAYHHMLARFMSLLFCAALQQVSPDRDRPFEILDSDGLDKDSLIFLNNSSDKVEVILQWIQRSTIINMGTGTLTCPPPILSRAFQELSRGIVNLQNARKIADFPFPFPYAQTSIVMLLIHWSVCPIVFSMLLNAYLSALACFVVVFFLWCINFIAFELEMPFGTGDNDLPTDQMQHDWNKSVKTLLSRKAQQPPAFDFQPDKHRRCKLVMSGEVLVASRRATVVDSRNPRGGSFNRTISNSSDQSEISFAGRVSSLDQAIGVVESLSKEAGMASDGKHHVRFAPDGPPIAENGQSIPSNGQSIPSNGQSIPSNGQSVIPRAIPPASSTGKPLAGSSSPQPQGDTDPSLNRRGSATRGGCIPAINAESICMSMPASPLGRLLHRQDR